MVPRRSHKERRRMLIGLYSKSTVQSSTEIQFIGQTILMERFLPILEASATDQSSFDALDLGLATAMDFITAYLFGISNSTNFLQDVRARRRWLAVHRKSKLHGFWPLEFPGLTSVLEKVGIHLVPPDIISASDEVKSLGLQLLDKVESSRLDSKDEQNMIPRAVSYDQLLHQFGPSSDGGPQTRLIIASEQMDNIFAGTETTAWTLTYVLYEISLHKEIQSSLRTELLSLSPPFVYSPASSTMPKLPSSRALDALPLLEAILLETLRLHPAVPGPQPRVTPSSSVSLDGYDNIPGGIRVSAQAYSLHRNSTVFPEPELWKAERWLRASPEEKTEMMRWFWAFGSGSRMCIGSSFAMLGQLGDTPFRLLGHLLHSEKNSMRDSDNKQS
jgi:unspecific monooxygenase